MHRMIPFFGLLLISHFSNGQNTPPTAEDDAYSVGFNYVLERDAAHGLLQNDSDTEGPLRVNTTAVTGPVNGTLLLNEDGSFTYTPDPGFSGTDGFTYRLYDDGSPSEIISQFDFNSSDILEAAVGPDAISANPDAVHQGCGVYFPSGAGSSTGLDIVVPNTSGIFGFTSFNCSFTYLDQEGTAEIVSGGNFRIYHISGDALGVRLTVVNGDTGSQEEIVQRLGDFLNGVNDYTVAYDEASGSVAFTAAGTTTSINVAPPNSPLDASLASNITIGRLMDGSGSTIPSLCNIQFVDTSILSDVGNVELSVHALLLTNRRITYRVNPTNQ